MKKYRVNFIKAKKYNKDNTGKIQYMVGHIDSVKDNKIWFVYKDKIYRVSKNKPNVYMLSDNNILENKINKKKIDLISPYTNIIFVGRFFIKDFDLISQDRDFFAVLFLDKKIIFEKIIKVLRYKNYFWTKITPPCLVVGSSILILYLFLNIENMNTIYIASYIILSLMPYLPLLPPGIFLYFFYKKLSQFSSKLSYKADILLYHSLTRHNFQFIKKIYKKSKTSSFFLSFLAIILLIVSVPINAILIFLVYITIVN